MTPVLLLMVMPAGQTGGRVGQRVAVRISGIGVEADERTLGVGAVSEVGAEDRRPVGVGHRPGEGVGVGQACRR